MRYGKNFPLPKTTQSEAVSIRSSEDSSDSTGLSLITYQDLTIMVWNIANLGGGFGYPIERDQCVIDAIATTIVNANVDVCIVLEVKRHGQPPSPPKIYAPRPVHMPRRLYSDEIETVMASLAEDGRKYYAAGKVGSNFLGLLRSTFVHADLQMEAAFNKGGGIIAQRQNIQDEIRWKLVRTAWNVTRQDAEREFAAIQNDTISDRYHGDIPDFIYEYYFDEGTTISDLHQLADVSRWFHEVDKPAVKHLPRYEAGRLMACYALLSNIHDRFRAWLHRQFARHLFWLSRDPTDGELDLCLNLFQSYYANIQHEYSDSDRRERLYLQKRESWEAARKKTKHPGVRELLRILNELNKSSDVYDCWPARHDPSDDKVNGSMDEFSISGSALADTLLYTEGETYGVLFRTHRNFIRTNLSLQSVTRAGGFKKRAPYIFKLALNKQNFNVIAWHAPSDSASNASAREHTFPVFSELPHRIARTSMEPTISVGDFNIDTAPSSAIRNAGKLTFSSQDLFAAVSGHLDFPSQTFFWNLRTSLKQFAGFRVSAPSPFDMGVGSVKFDLLSCAFDKIAAYWPSCVGWLASSEAVVPLPHLLGSSAQQDRLTPLSVEGDGGHPIGLLAIGMGMFGLSSMLDSLTSRSDKLDWDLASRLLALTRKISDHLPILTTFNIPSTGIARSFECEPIVLAKSIDDPVAKGASSASSGYTNIGGGDCLFHAVLHRLSGGQQTALGINPLATLNARIQALRTLAGAEIRTNAGRYSGFLRSGQTIDGAATQIETMRSWNNYAGDLAPLAIANAIGRSFQIHTTSTGRNITVNATVNAGNIAPLNYNGFDHYW
jgi:hypothetical protein